MSDEPPPLTVEEAKAMCVCRICREPIRIDGVPTGWMDDFNVVVYPFHVILRYGKEFAHAACLKPEDVPGDEE